MCHPLTELRCTTSPSPQRQASAPQGAALSLTFDVQVAKRLKIPLSAATLMVFALCEVRVAAGVYQIVR